MKYLTLMRHGEAEDLDNTRDALRSLTKRGRNEISSVATSLSADGICFDRVLSSSALRAHETTRAIASTLHIPETKILYRDDFYLANEEIILSEVSALDDALKEILVVGHNPTLFVCAGLLHGEREGALPTAGCIGLTLHIDEWKHLTPACASVRFRKYPEHR